MPLSSGATIFCSVGGLPTHRICCTRFRHSHGENHLNRIWAENSAFSSRYTSVNVSIRTGMDGMSSGLCRARQAGPPVPRTKQVRSLQSYFLYTAVPASYTVLPNLLSEACKKVTNLEIQCHIYLGVTFLQLWVLIFWVHHMAEKEMLSLRPLLFTHPFILTHYFLLELFKAKTWWAKNTEQSALSKLWCIQAVFCMNPIHSGWITPSYFATYIVNIISAIRENHDMKQIDFSWLH